MRVLVLEDQAFFNAYLTIVCRETFRDTEVVSVDTIATARRELLRARCSLMVLDILLPDGNGFDFAVEALHIEAGLKIVGLSADCSEYGVYRLCESPLRVFVDKNAHSVDVLRRAMRAAMAGELYFSPSVDAVRRRLASHTESFPKKLTPREIAILSKVGLGWPDDRIAEQLMISPWTVNWHCRQLMFRLGLTNRAELIVFANEKGFSCLHPCMRNRTTHPGTQPASRTVSLPRE